LHIFIPKSQVIEAASVVKLGAEIDVSAAVREHWRWMLDAGCWIRY
jgi:hypothetical protein